MNRAVFVLLAVIFALALLSLATFVGTGVGPQSTFQIRPDKETVLFSVTPWGDALNTKNAYRPLLNYLSEKTGKKFQALVIEDYETAIDNIADGSIDIAVIPPVSYVTAKERRPGIQYISTLVREKEGKRFATYKGYIVALKSRFEGWDFDKFLLDPSQYRFGFVTKKSSSGWAYPMAMMRKRGLDPYRIFKGVTVYENHPGVTDSLILGEIDLGATWEYNLEKAREKYGDRFTIVYTTTDIPGLAWVASENVDPEFVETIRKIQSELESKTELKNELLKETPDKGWEVVDENFYDEVREVIKYVGTFE